MDGNSSSPTRGDPVISLNDWRSRIYADGRKRVVNKIMETLRKTLSTCPPEGISELHKISARFEEKIYTTATSENDYLRKISLKMLLFEQKYANINSAAEHQDPPDQDEPEVSCITDCDSE